MLLSLKSPRQASAHPQLLKQIIIGFDHNTLVTTNHIVKSDRIEPGNYSFGGKLNKVFKIALGKYSISQVDGIKGADDRYPHVALVIPSLAILNSRNTVNLDLEPR